MFQRRSKRYRYRSNGRSNNHHRGSRDIPIKTRNHSFINAGIRNNSRVNQSAEKLLEKYNVLAKEALSSGDRVLSENYLQHADHFMRIVEDKNKNQVKVQAIDKPSEDGKNLSENNIDDKYLPKEKKEN